MEDIVTKYRDIIEDCELLLGDNNNLKNMSRNDIDKICRYVIVDIYKKSSELTIIALVNIYIKATIVEANADYDRLKTAKMLEVTDTDVESAQKRLQKLIRDVNKCITLLSEQ